MGSFRLAAGMWHLHHNYNFTGSVVETVHQSLRLSCRSELHVYPRFPVAQTIPSPDRNELIISLPKYFRLPDGFIHRQVPGSASYGRPQSQPSEVIKPQVVTGNAALTAILPSVLPAVEFAFAWLGFTDLSWYIGQNRFCLGQYSYPTRNFATLGPS